MSGLFVTGTDTGVGKTAIASGLLGALRRMGIRVAGMKPAETGWEGAPGSWPPDGARLSRGAARVFPPEQVVPYVFPEPLAPAVAAKRAGRVIDPAVLDRALRALRRESDLVIVEGAGGLAVPLTDGLAYAGLAARWRMPLVVVARPNLGTINHTVLTIEYARQCGLEVLGVVINAYPAAPSPAEATSPDVIRKMTGVPILGRIPWVESPTVEGMADLVSEHLDLDPALSLISRDRNGKKAKVLSPR